MTASVAANADLPLNAAPTDFGSPHQGFALLVGGTSEKEFFLAESTAASIVSPLDTEAVFTLPTSLTTASFAVAARPTLTTDGAEVAETVSTAALPIVASARFAHQIGDSVVQYTCGWNANKPAATTDGFRTMGGIDGDGAAGADNLCAQTMLVGLTVIPVHDVTVGGVTIAPGDFLRINFPLTAAGGANLGAEPAAAPATGAGIVAIADEEIYRVNAVMENDLVVTAKPLTDDANGADNVHRYPGGTALDLIRATGVTFTYSAVNGGTGQILATNAFSFTASSTQGVTPGQYCLIDNEFMMITSISSTNVIDFVIQSVPAVTTNVLNQGRGAFGTDEADTHAAAGTCVVYELLNGIGQGVGHPVEGHGFTTIYDPRVTIRQIAAVNSDTSVRLETGGQELVRTASEPGQMIGDPHEPFQNAQPVRAGTDFSCAHGDTTLPVLPALTAIVAEDAAQVGGAAATATSTVVVYDNVDNIEVGDYLALNSAPTDAALVTNVDRTTRQVTMVRGTHPTPVCQNVDQAPAADRKSVV